MTRFCMCDNYLMMRFCICDHVLVYDLAESDVNYDCGDWAMKVAALPAVLQEEADASVFESTGLHFNLSERAQLDIVPYPSY